MLKMSFYDGTLRRDEAKFIIERTEKPIFYRYGFSYRGAELNKIDKTRALEIIDKQSYLDIDEEVDRFILNAYSDNDMW